VANLWWMAALTAVMVYEKVGRRGARATRPAGVLLLALALLVLLHPAWLPSALTAA
jgi:predicted metal-binding membrane protein